MASRIVIPATAFAATNRRTKRQRADSGDYLDFIRSLPCLITGDPSQAAHVNYDDLRYGKIGRGKGTKDDDCWAVPLSEPLHRQQHDAGDERKWWLYQGIDPVPVALALWRCWQLHDYETALIVIQHAGQP